jgi:hypothetical protein
VVDVLSLCSSRMTGMFVDRSNSKFSIIRFDFAVRDLHSPVLRRIVITPEPS